MRCLILIVLATVVNVSGTAAATAANSAAAPACSAHRRALAGTRSLHTSHLRPLRGWISRLLDEARPQSPTLDRLARLVEALPLIVYIDEAGAADSGWDGRIRFMTAAGGYRYLHIDLRRLSRAQAASVLAHELQHALEVALAGVSSRAEFDALYRRIGLETPGRDGPHYDTPAAVAAGIAAITELAEARTRAGGTQ